jgi:hypothetical protein
MKASTSALSCTSSWMYDRCARAVRRASGQQSVPFPLPPPRAMNASRSSSEPMTYGSCAPEATLICRRAAAAATGVGQSLRRARCANAAAPTIARPGAAGAPSARAL